MGEDLAGVLPVLQTPFRPDGEIDFNELEREIHWLVDDGADGVVTGMVTEVLRLSSEERDALTEVVCRSAASRGVPATISVGAESCHTAVRHARVAEAAGASALMAIPPIAVALGESELVGYYHAILDSTNLPLVVQDASGYVGRPMAVQTQATMLAQFGARVMFKPEAEPVGPRLSALREVTSGQARVFEGSGGRSLIDNFRRGIAGTMPGADIVWAIVGLWEALAGGDDDRAYAIHAPIVGLSAMLAGLDSYLAVEKYLLQKQGIFTSTYCRGPVGFELDVETRSEVDRLFDRLREVCGRPA